MTAVSHDQQVNKNNSFTHASPILIEDDGDVGKSIGQSELGVPNKSCSSTRVVPDIQYDINIAMTYANGTALGTKDAGSMPSDVNETNPPNVLSGRSTIEKRNRKKRKAKVLFPASPLSTLNLEPVVDNFYQKYLNYKFFKDNPTVQDFNDQMVSYDKFYNALEPIDEVDDEVMDAYVVVFNHENANPDPKSKKPSKFSFSTHFTVIAKWPARCAG